MSVYTYPFLGSVFVAIAALAFVPTVEAQTRGDEPPELLLCDPLLSREVNPEQDDENEIPYEVKYRYDLERAEVISDLDQIADELFEERWNFSTVQMIPRHELCESRVSYVIHWAQIFGKDDDGNFLIDAEGLLAFKRDGSFEYVFEDRPYTGGWSLDGSEIVLDAKWLNAGRPMRAPLERVYTPVEVTYEDGRQETNVEEQLRLGWFRMVRIATTEKGKIQKCSCEEDQIGSAQR